MGEKAESGEKEETKGAAEGEEKKALPEDPKKLLVEMLSSKYTELKPTLDPVQGCRYPEVEEMVSSPEDASRLLEKLTEEGLLARELHGKHLRCPYCRSANVGTLALCPSCKSHNIEKKSLLEHFKCGNISEDEKYRAEGKLVCPKCKTELKTPGKDYRVVGSWFFCHNCKKKFEEFHAPQHCRKCGEQFPIGDAELAGCYSYTLRGEGEFKRVIEAVSTLRSFLESTGYTVNSPSVIKGSSGVNHQFDILASKGEDKKIAIAVEHADKEEAIGEQSIMSFFAKIYDIGNIPAMLIALPGLNKTATQLAAMYKLTVIEAKDSKEAVEKLKATLEKA